MQINDDFDANLSRPLNTFVEISRSTADVRRTRGVKGPETNWDSHNIEAAVLDFLEVFERDPRVPMRLEHFVQRPLRADCISERLAECPLVYYACRWTKTLEDGRSNPWFEDEPASQVDASDFLA